MFMLLVETGRASPVSRGVLGTLKQFGSSDRQEKLITLVLTSRQVLIIGCRLV